VISIIQQSHGLFAIAKLLVYVDLVTSGASWLESLGVMTAAVQSAATRRRHTAAVAAADVEVDEIDEQFGADTADEALWMPVTGWSST